ncbi:MAG: integrase, partial [Boseongicola sp. SB0670_bin_30]|nr:integrase [Boseongicola sp. SB0670_bin_30]
MTDLAPHVSGFLREHLPRQRNASRHTIASYSDSLLLLVCYVADCLKVRPSAISIEELTTDLIFGFLDHLEANRRNSVSTRNVRLAAVKSLFRYLEYRLPSCLELARQVHA